MSLKKSNILSNKFLKPFSKINFTSEILAGLTVAFALVPESIAFAFVAGVSPMLSLQTAVVMGLVAVLFTGRPGMISSSTASISVVMAALVASHGLDHLFAAVILMGVIQLIIGILKLGKYARIIPYPVMLGFLNGLAMLIFFSQIELFKVNTATGKEWLQGFDLVIMLFFVIVTMVIIHFFPKLNKKYLLASSQLLLLRSLQSA
ncbi:SulP family inorganic anion transporter [Amphibacillus indicireducens]|uniref:SLC26A/SulP transporter domain-containing protein n=1 Tax=Amphibacillus indicireducens TaxID=1076330 RepID=A0ABP7V1C3_9BACI